MHKTSAILCLLLSCFAGTGGAGSDSGFGDLVYSYDTITGEVTQKEVTAVFVRESDHINYLTIIDEDGNEQIIETTDSHPFWVVTDEPDLSRAARSVVDENGVILYHENLAPGLNGFWVEAKDLREGDVFLGANGELSTLVAAERVVFPEGIKVYNFTVDGNHNYFVIAKCDEFGQTCILVHNAGNYDLHHATPKEVLKELKNANNPAANDKLVRGIRGAPNRIPVLRDTHKAIHQGAGGGLWNEMFKNAIVEKYGGYEKVTAGQIIKIRNALTWWFGLH